MTAVRNTTQTPEGERTIIQLAPSFWAMVIFILSSVATVTAVIYARPDRAEVRGMITDGIRDVRSDIRRVDEKVDNGQANTQGDLNRIEQKLDKLIERY